MKYKKIIILLLFIAPFCAIAQSAECPIIPMPQSAIATGSSFRLSTGTNILYTDKKYRSEVDLFITQLKKWNVIKLRSKQSNSAGTNSIFIASVVQKDTAGYTLEVQKNGIVILANNKTGVSNALSSLLQLLLLGKKENNAIVIDGWNIKDAPMYAWRGFMLDESRHFFGQKEVEKILDQMYLFKLNTLHWHLTDEPAWRLQIKKYPLLTTIGSKGNYTDTSAPALYYTQNEIKQIVAYAALRHITVISEVDMPGHATAANKAYPEYSGGGSAKHPDFTFNPGNEKVYSYLTDILKETTALFPYGMIHIGGDEVSFGNEKWKTDPLIMALKQKNHLKDDIAVERYFVRRMADSVMKMGNTVLGWDEIVDMSLPKDSTLIFWWHHERPEALQTALDKGYRVVLAPRKPLYFDFVQYDRDKVGRRWDGFNTVKNVYDFSVDSVKVSITPDQRKLIVGMQANLWTETVLTKNRLEYLIFPRLVAAAEAAWTPAPQKNYTDFERRVTAFYPLWKALDIHYFDVQNPNNTPEISDKTSKVDYLDKK